MKRKITPYLFLAPAIFIMLIFVYTPIVQGVYNSLFQWNAISPKWIYVGLGNYKRLLGDKIIWLSIKNNLWYAVISVFFQVFIALVLAAILESGIITKRVSSIFRTSLFIPSILSVSVVGLTWNLLLRPQQGLVNQFLDIIGLHQWSHAWLGDEKTAIFSIIGVSQWQWVGYIMVLFIVAIQAIPQELYEAAKIDGANGIQQFIYITIPSVRETTLVMSTITVIGAFKVFDIVWVMTGGGPNNSSQVIGSYMYKTGFRIDEMGYASAIAIIIFIITFSFTALQLRIGRTGQEA